MVAKGIVDVPCTQDSSCGENKLVHVVEQVLLYRTTLANILVYSTFLIKFFKHFYEVVLHIVRKGTPKKSLKILLISTDSDAVFHEESEYAIGFMIRLKNDGISSIFRYYFDFCFCKKMQK
jgi:hypothetical protein